MLIRASLFFALSFASPALAQPPTCHILEYTCPSPPEPYTVRPSLGKGLGVFARHSLDPGEIILREAPVLTITPPSVPKGSPYPLADIGRLVAAEYARLSEKDKHDVLALSLHADPEEWSEDVDVLAFIFRTNAYNTGTSIGLFPKIARINHSCRPNAAYYWNEILGKRVITATRRIDAGEEIFVSFISLLASREERQRKLSRYGFTCTCEACTHAGKQREVSDQQRLDIGKAFLAFSTQFNLTIPTHPSSLRKARKNAAASLKLAEMVQEEGLADYYASACKIVAISHARVRDWERASVWANKGFELRVREDERSAATMEMWELTRRFVESWEGELKGMQEGGGK
ncbi:hypothetical protein BDV96DRAFT_504215 [Lophiotrema nucula]|uniref:SET domain-containing protein n=1 Tax=Lophiotrema nucula TaxID=690887 RepID=A0A6A5YRI9_9PLEO|nr:hypothetical protein BDV96DRAFT_504215 [Lophiotrema nucula]